MDYRLPTLQHHHSDSNVSHASSYQLAHDEIDPDLLSLRSGAGGADHLSSEDGNAASGLVQIGNSLSGRSESIGPGGTNADGTPVIRRLACTACRAVKAKCDPPTPTSEPLDPCKRCLRLSVDCIYVNRRRPTRGPDSPLRINYAAKTSVMSFDKEGRVVPGRVDGGEQGGGGVGMGGGGGGGVGEMKRSPSFVAEGSMPLFSSTAADMGFSGYERPLQTASSNSSSITAAGYFQPPLPTITTTPSLPHSHLHPNTHDHNLMPPPAPPSQSHTHSAASTASPRININLSPGDESYANTTESGRRPSTSLTSILRGLRNEDSKEPAFGVPLRTGNISMDAALSGPGGSASSMTNNNNNPSYALSNPASGSRKRRRLRSPSDEGEEDNMGIGMNGMTRLMDWEDLVRARMGVKGREGVVELGLVTREKRDFLVNTFMDRHNSYIAILDPLLHTPTHLSLHSPILETAICAAASQAYDPDNFNILTTRVQYMFGKAFERGDLDVSLCQALSIASIWKESHDATTYLKVGHAIRIGYELGLDKAIKRPLPEDERAARLILNEERTWRQLGAFDRTLSYTHGRRPNATVTKSIQEMESWATDHPQFLAHADAMLGASSAPGYVLCSLAFSSEDKYLNDIVAKQAEAEVIKWKAAWLGSTPLAPLHPLSRSIIGFYATSNDFELSLFKSHCAAGSRNEMESMMNTAHTAGKVLEYMINTFVDNAVLDFAPDVFVVRVGRASLWLFQYLDRWGEPPGFDILALFKRLQKAAEACDRRHNPSHNLARFVGGLTRVAMVSNTRRQSRAGSPVAGVGAGFLAPAEMSLEELEQQEGSMLDLEQLLLDAQTWFGPNFLTGQQAFAIG